MITLPAPMAAQARNPPSQSDHSQPRPRKAKPMVTEIITSNAARSSPNRRLSTGPAAAKPPKQTSCIIDSIEADEDVMPVVAITSASTGESATGAVRRLKPMVKIARPTKSKCAE